MRTAGLVIASLLVVLAQSSPVATQPWNLPRPIVLNGCSENALIIAVKQCASDSCGSALARYANVDAPYTICCVRNEWGLLRRGDAYPAACQKLRRLPFQPPKNAPFLQ